jgi:hypothetical protein
MMKTLAAAKMRQRFARARAASQRMRRLIFAGAAMRRTPENAPRLIILSCLIEL